MAWKMSELSNSRGKPGSSRVPESHIAIGVKKSKNKKTNKEQGVDTYISINRKTATLAGMKPGDWVLLTISDDVRVFSIELTDGTGMFDDDHPNHGAVRLNGGKPTEALNCNQYLGGSTLAVRDRWQPLVRVDRRNKAIRFDISEEWRKELIAEHKARQRIVATPPEKRNGATKPTQHPEDRT